MPRSLHRLVARFAAALIAVAIGTAGAPSIPLVKTAHKCFCPRRAHDCRCPVCSARSGHHRKAPGPPGAPCVDPSCGLPDAPGRPGRLTDPFVLPEDFVSPEGRAWTPIADERLRERTRPSRPAVPPPRLRG